MRTFFVRPPFAGSFLIHDMNRIWGSEFTERILRAMAYPGGLDAATADQRPADVIVAFEMHRHYGWDFTLTTPNIGKVSSVVREVAEVAFRHQNRGLIGLRGSYWEIMHTADNIGKAKGDQLMFQTKRVRDNVFQRYRSTSTGTVADTQAGRNVFLQPAPIAVALVVVAAVVVLIVHGRPHFMREAVAKPEPPQPTQSIALGDAAPAAPGAVAPPAGGSPPAPVRVVKSRFARFVGGRRLVYSGEIGSHQLFALVDGKGRSVTLERQALLALGVQIHPVARCLFEVVDGDDASFVQCEADAPPAQVQQPTASPLASLMPG